ncbi:MAG: protocatechuate 3,4-dioxygenase subunit beta [Alphaproteobacteria bacterium]|nr:protocatechuate 3,4-dioxygenase subunit beta [Alphaproteobacteria bacterium]
MTDMDRDRATGKNPPILHPYGSTAKRAPSHRPLAIPRTLTEMTGPLYGHASVDPGEADLTQGHAGEPQGERIILAGRVVDAAGGPVPDTLIELWQTNAAGRYLHAADRHPAPLDPNFTGAGRAVTDGQGQYRFTSIKPGAYPWRNHPNAWRPAHIHLSLFGPSLTTRLVTQMYFPGDPLLAFDPIFNAVPDLAARQRLVAGFDWNLTEPEWALGYRFDVVLGGRRATPMED